MKIVNTGTTIDTKHTGIVAQDNRDPTELVDAISEFGTQQKSAKQITGIMIRRKETIPF